MTHSWGGRSRSREVPTASPLNEPIHSVQIFNLLEVAVSGYKDHPVTFRRCSDPDVVLGEGPPFFLQI
jgi:hypothetical protein